MGETGKTVFEALQRAWEGRNIRGRFASGRQECLRMVLEEIPVPASVGFSGSMTLEALGIVASLQARGTPVFDHNQPGLSRSESQEVRRRGSGAQVYLGSPNAVAKSGELVFLSAYGNRTAGIAYAPKLILVAGSNKVTPDLTAALERARSYATPLNCRRLQYRSACLESGLCREELCRFPAFDRMCCQTLIIEAERDPQRVTVILVDEALGY